MFVAPSPKNVRATFGLPCIWNADRRARPRSAARRRRWRWRRCCPCEVDEVHRAADAARAAGRAAHELRERGLGRHPEGERLAVAAVGVGLDVARLHRRDGADRDGLLALAQVGRALDLPGHEQLLDLLLEERGCGPSCGTSRAGRAGRWRSSGRRASGVRRPPMGPGKRRGRRPAVPFPVSIPHRGIRARRIVNPNGRLRAPPRPSGRCRVLPCLQPLLERAAEPHAVRPRAHPERARRVGWPMGDGPTSAQAGQHARGRGPRRRRDLVGLARALGASRRQRRDARAGPGRRRRARVRAGLPGPEPAPRARRCRSATSSATSPTR